MEKKITMNNASQVEALEALTRSWPHIVEECRGVLGSELHLEGLREEGYPLPEPGTSSAYVEITA